EADHAPARVAERKHDAAPEAVVEASLAALLREPGGVKLLLAVALLECARKHAVPGTRGKADAELLEHLAAEPATLQVRTRARRLRRLPQVAGIETGRLREQLVETLARASALLLGGIARLVGELDAK